MRKSNVLNFAIKMPNRIIFLDKMRLKKSKNKREQAGCRSCSTHKASDQALVCVFQAIRS